MAKPLGYSGAGPVREEYKHRRCQGSCLPISPRTDTTLSPSTHHGEVGGRKPQSFFRFFFLFASDLSFNAADKPISSRDRGSIPTMGRGGTVRQSPQPGPPTRSLRLPRRQRHRRPRRPHPPGGRGRGKENVADGPGPGWTALGPSFPPDFPRTCPGGRSTRSAGCCGRCKRLARRSPSLPPSRRAAAAPSSPGPAVRPPPARRPVPPPLAAAAAAARRSTTAWPLRRRAAAALLRPKAAPRPPPGQLQSRPGRGRPPPPPPLPPPALTGGPAGSGTRASPAAPRRAHPPPRQPRSKPGPAPPRFLTPPGTCPAPPRLPAPDPGPSAPAPPLSSAPPPPAARRLPRLSSLPPPRPAVPTPGPRSPPAPARSVGYGGSSGARPGPAAPRAAEAGLRPRHVGSGKGRLPSAPGPGRGKEAEAPPGPVLSCLGAWALPRPVGDRGDEGKGDPCPALAGSSIFRCPPEKPRRCWAISMCTGT